MYMCTVMCVDYNSNTTWLKENMHHFTGRVLLFYSLAPYHWKKSFLSYVHVHVESLEISYSSDSEIARFPIAWFHAFRT